MLVLKGYKFVIFQRINIQIQILNYFFMQSSLTELLHHLTMSQFQKNNTLTETDSLNRLQQPPKMTSGELLQKIYETINKKDNQKDPVIRPIHKQSSSINSDDLSSHTQTTKCNCKKSKCLKLYCECFAQGVLCKGCNCVCCNNTDDFSEIRAKAIDDVMCRGPLIFGHKYSSIKGCSCKKTGCLKKYCECYGNGQKCNEYCKCNNCENGQ